MRYAGRKRSLIVVSAQQTELALEEWLGFSLAPVALFTKYVARLMIEQGRKGSIINLISTAGHQGQPRNVGYCTGKSGLLNIERPLVQPKV